MRCLFFLINVCNILSLHYNFQFVEHQLFFCYLNRSSGVWVFLLQTLLLCSFDPSYYIYHQFSSKPDCYPYVHNDDGCFIFLFYLSSEFYPLMHRLSFKSTTNIICSAYVPNSTDYTKLLAYLSKIDHILSTFPLSEIIIRGHFNIRHNQLLSSNSTRYEQDRAGELDFLFSISNILSR